MKITNTKILIIKYLSGAIFIRYTPFWPVDRPSPANWEFRSRRLKSWAPVPTWWGGWAPFLTCWCRKRPDKPSGSPPQQLKYVSIEQQLLVISHAIIMTYKCVRLRSPLRPDIGSSLPSFLGRKLYSLGWWPLEWGIGPEDPVCKRWTLVKIWGCLLS